MDSVGSKWNHFVDPQAEPDLLEQARMVAKRHEDRWTKLVPEWNPAKSIKQKRYP